MNLPQSIKNIYTTTDGLKIGIIDIINDVYVFVRDKTDGKFGSEQLIFDGKSAMACFSM